ncbi:MAG: DUF3795 domain-containing protein [Candidatus Lokiarchaeota archaeon]
MKNIIAYCGINCSECPAYIATQKKIPEEIEKVAKEWSNSLKTFKPSEIYCDGCNSNGRHFSWCNECTIRNCCLEKELQNCAYCEDYDCEKLKITFEKTPSAKDRLDQIKKNL